MVFPFERALLATVPWHSASVVACRAPVAAQMDAVSRAVSRAAHVEGKTLTPATKSGEMDTTVPTTPALGMEVFPYPGSALR